MQFTMFSKADKHHILIIKMEISNALNALASRFDKVLFQKRVDEKNEFNNSLCYKLTSHKPKIEQFDTFEEESGRQFIRL